ncbi:extracellular solute-binding protein [Nitriliruptor alkaliphilus]|uniref:extracellular solute-binding protein n=1 Tax=Nitriliruptor alkaliphilus TaxID=427918 RepID=UPI000698F241|nr:extracellular solute-binding protein [Nitriliruptor alkaliphilus]
MLNMRRGARTIALSAAVALTLSACAGGGDDGDGDGEDPPAAADDGEVDEPDPVDADAIEVPIWIAFTDARLDWTRDVAAAFNEQLDGYEITVQGYDNYEALFDAALLAVDQGDPPAVVQYFEAATTEANDAVSGSGDPLFASVTAAIGGRDEILGVPVVIDDIVDAAASYYQIDGELTSMPWNTSSAIMFTNRDLMEAGGVDQIPETWQDLQAACDTIMGSDAAPENCVTWPNHSWFIEQTIAQQGEVLANNDNGRADRADEVNIDSDAMIDYVTWWKDMQDAGHYVYTGVQRDWDGTYNAFASQQLPFLIYSSSDTTLLTDEGESGGYTVEASFMPHNADRADGGNIIGGATLWLIDGLDEGTEDAALAFLNFLNNPENAASWHQTTGYIPITNASIDLLESEGWFSENPNSAVAGEQLDAAPDSPATAGVLMGNFVAIRDAITGAIEDVLVNDLDPAERMGQADGEAQRLLEDYNQLYVE